MARDLLPHSEHRKFPQVIPMGADTIDIIVRAKGAALWSLLGIAQAVLAAGLARLIVHGSLRAAVDPFLSRIRRWGRTGNWVRIEAYCCKRRGPFARFTLLFAAVRENTGAQRQKVLDSARQAFFTDLRGRMHALLLTAIFCLGLGVFGSMVRWVTDTEHVHRVDLPSILLPALVGASQCLFLVGTCGLIRSRLVVLAADFDLLQSVLESWPTSGEVEALSTSGHGPWSRWGQAGQALPPFWDN